MAKNPLFKRIPRITTLGEQRDQQEQDRKSEQRRAKKFQEQKRREKQDKKEFRQKTVGTLGELTEKFMGEGFSEDDSFNQAKDLVDELDNDPEFKAKNGFSGIVKKETKFIVGEKGSEFVEVIPLQNKNRPVLDLGLNLGFKLGKTTRKKKVVDFDFFNEPKKKQATRRKNKQDFNFFEVF